jgi:hypothetical protein
VLSSPEGNATAFSRTTLEIVRGKDVYMNNLKAFFDDIEGLHPTDAIAISHILPTNDHETSGQAPPAMMARSYAQWNPCGMKAVW